MQHGPSDPCALPCRLLGRAVADRHRLAPDSLGPTSADLSRARTESNRPIWSSTPPPCGARCGKSNVTLGLGNVTLQRHPPWSAGLSVAHRPPGRQGRRSEAPARMVALRARLVPRLTIRPPLLTLAPLAPLTAGAGVGNRHSPIDVGPSGAKSAPPGINRKGETPWQPSPQSPWPAT